MVASDLYITEEQEDRLQDLLGEGDELLAQLREIGVRHSVVVASCYIRCNTRQDPPLGDMILRVELGGSEADMRAFCADVLHLIR